MQNTKPYGTQNILGPRGTFIGCPQGISKFIMRHKYLKKMKEVITNGTHNRNRARK